MTASKDVEKYFPGGGGHTRHVVMVSVDNLNEVTLPTGSAEADRLARLTTGTHNTLAPLTLTLTELARVRHEEGNSRLFIIGGGERRGPKWYTRPSGNYFVRSNVIRDDEAYPYVYEYKHKLPKWKRRGRKVVKTEPMYTPREYEQDLTNGGSHSDWPDADPELNVFYGGSSEVKSISVRAATFNGNRTESGAHRAKIAEQAEFGITHIGQTPLLEFLLRNTLTLAYGRSGHGNPGVRINVEDPQNPVFTFYVGGHVDYNESVFKLTHKGLIPEDPRDGRDEAILEIMADPRWTEIGTAEGYIKLLEEMTSLIPLQEQTDVLLAPEIFSLRAATGGVPAITS